MFIHCTRPGWVGVASQVWLFVMKGISMVVTELLGTAARLIMESDKTAPGPYGLFCIDKELVFKPLRQRRYGDIFLFRLNKGEAKSGLRASEWGHLQRILRRLRSEGKL